jgi:AmmeMemoRadiSam system protein B
MLPRALAGATLMPDRDLLPDLPDLPDPPALRPLDVRRSQRVNQPGIVLEDQLGLSEPTFVPEQLLPIVGRCTGEASLDEIRAAASEQVGEEIPLDFVRTIVDDLDRRLLLFGPRFLAAVEQAANDFLASGVRPARHAGSAGYPADPAALRVALGDLLGASAPAAGPGAPHLRGLIAPHIDLARGMAGYRAAYERLLAAPPADLYVVFGTGHAGPSAPVTGLPLDWQTPLGVVRTDRDFVAAVHASIGAPAAADLLHHRLEHSLEFQMLLLQHLHERRGTNHPFQVAGFLCGALPSEHGNPLAEPWCQRLLEAFRSAAQASNKTVCYLAGADLAHIGPFFGDARAVDQARLDRLAAAERTRLSWLEQGSPGPFHAAVDCGNNPDRVCSAPAITLCAALAEGPGELLHYGQAKARDGSQTVSFCAMAFPGPNP